MRLVWYASSQLPRPNFLKMSSFPLEMRFSPSAAAPPVISVNFCMKLGASGNLGAAVAAVGDSLVGITKSGTTEGSPFLGAGGGGAALGGVASCGVVGAAGSIIMSRRLPPLRGDAPPLIRGSCNREGESSGECALGWASAGPGRETVPQIEMRPHFHNRYIPGQKQSKVLLVACFVAIMRERGTERDWLD